MLIALTLSLFFGSTAQALTQTERINPKIAAEVIKQVIDQTDPKLVQALQERVESAALISSEGFVPMSDGRKPELTFLTCAIGEGAIFVKLTVGICISSKGGTFTLGGPGIGVAYGAKASLVMGLVKSTSGRVRGVYDTAALGKNFKALEYGNLLKSLGALKLGVGVNAILGRMKESETDPSGRLMVLLGPSLGSMYDVSLSDIQIY